MRQELDEKDPAYLKTFPTDANVRLAVTGLAYCELRKGDSIINFLRHVPLHQLEITIFRRKEGERAELWRGPEVIGTDKEVMIKYTGPVPQKLGADLNTGEYRLNEMINLRHYHGKHLMPKELPAGEHPPSRLTVQNFRYYTLELMETDHSLSENSEPIEIRKFGYSLGGKINFSQDQAISIEVDDPALPPFEPFSYSDTDDKQWLYDIYISNHCKDTESEKCPRIGPRNLDFRHYYDVLKDSQNQGRVFELETERTVKMLRIGACNVAIIEPDIAPPDII